MLLLTKNSVNKKTCNLPVYLINFDLVLPKVMFNMKKIQMKVKENPFFDDFLAYTNKNCLIVLFQIIVWSP